MNVWGAMCVYVSGRLGCFCVHVVYLCLCVCVCVCICTCACMDIMSIYEWVYVRARMGANDGVCVSVCVGGRMCPYLCGVQF